MYSSFSSEIIPPKSSGFAVRAHKLVGPVDIAHVVENTECEVLANPGCAIHPASDGIHEADDPVIGALSPITEILAGEFSDPNFAAKRVMITGAVVDEILRIGTVPMKSDGVDSASVASSNETLQPSQTGRSVGRGRRNQPVPLALKRLDILLPQGGAVARVNVRLAGLVGFIEAQDAMSITSLDKSGEIADLLRTPEHRDTLDIREFA